MTTESTTKVQTDRAYVRIGDKSAFRILAMLLDEDVALVIDLDCRSARIREEELPALNTLLFYRKLLLLEEEDDLINEEMLSGEAKIRFTKLKPVLQRLIEPGIVELSKKPLWPAIKAAAAEVNLSPDTINLALTRVMQAGMRLTAAVAKWRRTPPKCTRTGQPKAFHLSVAAKGNIESGVRRFLRGEATWEEAYDQFLTEYYPGGIKESGGVRIITQLPRGQRPSFDQFKKQGRRLVSVADRLKLRFGELGFQMNHRGKPNGQSIGAHYPGYAADFDWTTSDIVFVTRDGRRAVGRLTVYVIICRFSGYVLAVYLTMANASYQESGRAVLACLEDPVEVHKRYGLSLTPEEITTPALPRHLTVDKGEMNSWKASSIATTTGIKIELCPSRRADGKGGAESFFKTLRWVLRRLPGGTSGFKERQKAHPNTTSVYDFDQLYALILSHRLLYNERLRKRQATIRGMAKNEILPIPRVMWQWAYSMGLLRSFSLAEARIGLLPAHFAKVTEAGIRIKGLNFVVPDFDPDQVGGIEANEWLARARKRRFEVECCIDESTIDHIWLRYHAPGSKPVSLKCALSSEHEGFKGLSWTMYGLMNKEIAARLKEHQETMYQESRARFYARVGVLTVTATDTTKQARKGMSKAQIAKGDPNARASEMVATPPPSVEAGVSEVALANSPDPVVGAPASQYFDENVWGND